MWWFGQILYAIGEIFIKENGEKLSKNLVVWSHWLLRAFEAFQSTMIFPANHCDYNIVESFVYSKMQGHGYRERETDRHLWLKTTTICDAFDFPWVFQQSTWGRTPFLLACNLEFNTSLVKTTSTKLEDPFYLYLGKSLGVGSYPVACS